MYIGNSEFRLETKMQTKFVNCKQMRLETYRIIRKHLKESVRILVYGPDFLFDIYSSNPFSGFSVRISVRILVRFFLKKFEIWIVPTAI